jgi:DNA-binding response OmpR family regulator
MNILIVEDEIIPAKYLEKILITAGYTVLSIASKGQQAIDMAKKLNPDIILMDIMLKGSMSGSEAATIISRNRPNILIVFLTAYSDQEMIDFAVESKAHGYLLKPYRDKEILATLALAKAQINKNSPKQTEKTIAENTIDLIDEYQYDLITKILSHKKKEVPLGPKALALIDLLCKNKSHTVRIDIILDELWESQKSKQTLRSLIHRIREQTSIDLIQNTNKLGYKIGLLH